LQSLGQWDVQEFHQRGQFPFGYGREDAVELLVGQHQVSFGSIHQPEKMQLGISSLDLSVRDISARSWARRCLY